MATGYTLIELMFVAGLVATLSAIAVPPMLAALDDLRALGAARYLSARCQRARTEAVMRSTDVGLRFTREEGVFAYAVYVDGNRNGIRTADISSGIDRQEAAPERLRDLFTKVDFGALPKLPAIDPGGTPPGDDPVRLGASNILSFSANGTSSSGTVYIRGQRAQYAVRVFGDTGKTRVLKFDARANRWRPL
jgi:type II secretory pathway pseudopilin PulG